LYTGLIMTTHDWAKDRAIRSQGSDSSLVQSRASMCEVQICGVPKLLALGVASTS
jgi:hypothetical protein